MNALNFLTTRDTSVAKRRFWIFLALWFMMNFVQGLFSGLNEDEAYYYIYAMYPDWGYFDHPPMVGAFIRMGIILFGQEVGMRFFAALSSTVFLFAVWKTIEKKEKWRYVNVFILMCLSIPMINAYAFILVPDAPLLCFTALFLFMYKRFLYSRSVSRAVILGLLAACMLYSKYHGVLILVLVILADISLLKNKYFYIAMAVAMLCFVPHVMWQIDANFPSLQYHLVDRSAPEWKFVYTWEYPLNQLAVFGPFTLPLMLIAAAKKKIKTPLARTMKYIFWGFLLFFLLMTAKGHVEPHWTVIAVIPAMYFMYGYAVRNETTAKIFVYGTIFTAALIALARILLLVPSLSTPYHNQEKWAADIEAVAGDSPVVFKDSYQKPSMYIYYTGHTAWTYNSPAYRYNQYDILPIKDEIQGKRVLYLGGDENSPIQIPTVWGDTLRGRWIDDFHLDSVIVKQDTDIEQ